MSIRDKAHIIYLFISRQLSGTRRRAARQQCSELEWVFKLATERRGDVWGIMFLLSAARRDLEAASMVKGRVPEEDTHWWSSPQGKEETFPDTTPRPSVENLGLSIRIHSARGVGAY